MRGLPRLVKNHLTKAREAALQAVEIYNKPGAHFRSGGFIVLMTIAWTSLFHAIFFRRKQKPWKKTANGRFVRLDGEPKHWELADCLGHFYESDTQNPVRKNLDLFIKLRNKIEHRAMPELDPDLFGECQAMLLNFDDLLRAEFGEKHCIRESLTFALQLFPGAHAHGEAVKRDKQVQSTTGFIRQYRSSLSLEVLGSSQYAFKAFLIEVANHLSQDALPVQFVKWGSLSPEQQQEVSRFAALTKTKEVPVVNPGMLLPSAVVKRVQTALGDPKVERGGIMKDRFNLAWHLRACIRYGAWRGDGTFNPTFCVLDGPHRDRVYAQAWVDLLVSKLKQESEWEALRSAQKTSESPAASEGKYA